MCYIVLLFLFAVAGLALYLIGDQTGAELPIQFKAG
jgi:hypothetical protein